MKYSNYIINSNFVNIESLVSSKKYLKQTTILIAIPVATMGILVLSSLLPMALAFDVARYFKSKYLHINPVK